MSDVTGFEDIINAPKAPTQGGIPGFDDILQRPNPQKVAGFDDIISSPGGLRGAIGFLPGMKGNLPAGGLPVPEGASGPMAAYVKKSTDGSSSNPIAPMAPTSSGLTVVPRNALGAGSGVLANPNLSDNVQVPRNTPTQVRTRNAPDPNMGWSDLVNQIAAYKSQLANGGLTPDQDIYYSSLHDLARQKLQVLYPQVQRLQNGGITGPSDAQSFQNMKQAMDALQQAVQVHTIPQVMARTAQANINAGSAKYPTDPLAMAGPDAQNFTPEAMTVQAGKTTDPKKQAALLNKAATMQSGNAAQAQQDMNDPMRTGVMSDIAESINAPIKKGIMAATVPGPLQGTPYGQVAEAITDNILGAINPASVSAFLGGAIQNPGQTLSAADELAQKALFLKKSDSVKDYVSSVIQTAMIAHGIDHGVDSLSKLATDPRIPVKVSEETGIPLSTSQEAVQGAIQDLSKAKSSTTEIPPVITSESTIPPTEGSKLGDFNAIRTTEGKTFLGDGPHEEIATTHGLTPDAIESVGGIKNGQYVPRETPTEPTPAPHVAAEPPVTPQEPATTQGPRVGETWRNPDTGTEYKITAQEGDKLSVAVTHDGQVQNPVRVTADQFDSRVNAEKGFESVKKPDAIVGLSNAAQVPQIEGGHITEPVKGERPPMTDVMEGGRGTTMEEGEALAKQVAAQTRPFSATEAARLTHAGREFQLAVNKSIADLDSAKKTGDLGKIAEAQQKFDELRTRHQQFVDDVQKGKTEWHNTGRALQHGLTLDEGNPAAVLAEAERLKNRGNQGPRLPLTAEETDAVLKGSKAHQEAVTRAEAAEAEVERLKAENAAKLETKAARSPRTQVKIEAIRGERQAAIDALKKLPIEALSRASANPLDIPIEAARQLAIIAKTFAQEGVANLEELVNKVNAHLKENGLPEQSDRTIYRALAGHGLEEAKTPTEAEMRVRDLKSQANLVERVNRIVEGNPMQVKTSKGVVSDTVKGLRKAYDSLLKQTGNAKLPDRTAALKTALGKAIDALEYGKPEGQPKIADNAEQAGLRNQIKVANTKARTADLKDQFASGNRSTKTPKPVEWSDILSAKQDLNDAAARVRLTDRLSALQDQIDTKTFPDKKTVREGPPDVQKLRADVKQRAIEAKQLREEIQRKAEFDQKTTLQKAGVYAAQTFQGLSRNLKLAIHASAPFMQGRKVLFVDPKAWVQSWGPMIHGYMGGDEAANAQLARFHADPLWDKAHAAGLSEVLAQPHGSLTQMEESIRADLSDRIPILNKVFSHSGAAFNGFLNEARWQMFKHVSEISQDPKYLAAMAREIGTMTGRSTSKLSKTVAPVGAFIFSPRYTVSKWEYATMKSLRGTESDMARNQIAQNYGKVAMGYTVAGLAAAQFFGGKVDLNPKSSNFGKLNIGKNDIDLFGAEAEPTKLVAQSFLGAISQKGKESKPNPVETGGRYIENKLLPIIRSPLDIAGGNYDEEGHHTAGAFTPTSPSQHAFDWGQELKDVLSPISIEGPYDEYKKGSNLSPWLSPFGIMTKYHQPPSPRK